MQKRRSLTDRMLLEGLSKGLSHKEIAIEYRGNIHKVGAYIARLRDRMKMKSTAEMMYQYGGLTYEHSYKELFDEGGFWHYDAKKAADSERS